MASTSKRNPHARKARVPDFPNRRTFRCTTCWVQNQVESWLWNPTRLCDDCGRHIGVGETVSKDIVHYSSHRETILKELAKTRSFVSNKKSVWKGFPFATFRKINEGREGKTTRRGGEGFVQHRRILDTQTALNRFFRLDTVANPRTGNAVSPSGIKTAQGSLKMLAPPVLLTHKTKHEGTVRMTHTLEVCYQVVTVSQVSGRVDHCPRHPVSHEAWGRTANVSSFDGAWSVKWFAVEAAIRLVDPDSDLGTRLKGQRVALHKEQDDRVLEASDPGGVLRAFLADRDTVRSSIPRNTGRQRRVAAEESEDGESEADEGSVYELDFSEAILELQEEML
jgi:hypothetical protein